MDELNELRKEANSDTELLCLVLLRIAKQTDEKLELIRAALAQANTRHA